MNISPFCFLFVFLSWVLFPLVSKAQVQFSIRPGKGLSMQTLEKDFSLNLGLRAQFLYTLEEKEGIFEQSFMIRRARIKFTGNLFGKKNRFKIELALSPRDIGLKNDIVTRSPLLDCYFTFEPLRDLSIQIGQYKVPFSKERILSSGNLQFVDRSIVNSEFNVDRDIGLVLFSPDLAGLQRLRYFVGISTGEGHSSFELADFGMLYITRMEWFPFGFFRDRSQSDATHSKRFRMEISAAYAFLAKAKKMGGIVGSLPQDGGRSDYHFANATLQMKVAGFSLFSEFMWRSGTRTAPDNPSTLEPWISTELPRNGWGTFAQVGYRLQKVPLEWVIRYGIVLPLASQTSLVEKHELGMGINYFFHNHSFKIQLDCFRFWATQGIEVGQNQFRIQMQLIF